jgi:ribosomal-protein-alanine N-acetyltransferase
MRACSEFQTPRLRIIRADESALRAELTGQAALEAALGITVPHSWPPPLFDRDDVSRYLNYLANGSDGWGLWHVIAKGHGYHSDCLIGIVGFGGKPAKNGDVIIGYSLVPEAQGNGYATEAVNVLVARALESGGASRVIAETFESLERSIAVLKRAGFQRCDGAETAGAIRYERRAPRANATVADLD